MSFLLQSQGLLDAAAGSVTGTLSKTDDTDAVSATATVAITATLSATDATDTLSGTASSTVTSSLSATDTADTLSGAAAVAISGSLASTDATDALTATATVGAAGVTGTLSATDAADTLAATGGTASDVPVTPIGGGGTWKLHKRYSVLFKRRIRTFDTLHEAEAYRDECRAEVAAAKAAQKARQRPVEAVQAPTATYEARPALRAVETIPEMPVLRLVLASESDVRARMDEADEEEMFLMYATRRR